MAMNKAEVPVEEVGFKNLAGVSQSVRLYSIPRFSVNRLVPVKSEEVVVGNELVYPYGGMHCHANNDTRFAIDFSQGNKKSRLSLSALVFFIVLLLLSWYFGLVSFKPLESESSIPIASPTVAPVTTSVVTSNNIPPPKIELQEKNSNNKAKLSNMSGESPAEQGKAVADEIPNKVSSLSNQKKATVAVPIKKTPVIKPTVIKKTITPTPKKIKAKKPAVIVWNVRKAKLAYRDKTLTKAEYNNVIRDLKITYKKKITIIKADYNNQRITKSEYKVAVTKAKNEYKGN